MFLSYKWKSSRSILLKALSFSIDFYYHFKVGVNATALCFYNGTVMTGFDADLVVFNQNFDILISIVGGKLKKNVL
jgi:N-acetylglucosamine-6-phosphate deacetylase